MAEQRKLRVEGRRWHTNLNPQRSPTRGVILECDTKGRCGDFEEWMVEWLDTRSFDVLPRAFVGAHTVDTPDTAIEAEADAAIAQAIQRVLQEAAK